MSGAADRPTVVSVAIHVCLPGVWCGLTLGHGDCPLLGDDHHLMLGAGSVSVGDSGSPTAHDQIPIE
jgi:hypothetical protein